MTPTRALRCLVGILLSVASFLKPFEAFARTGYTKDATELIVAQLPAKPSVSAPSAVLPMRNLQIEIRQQGSDSTQRSSIEAQGGVILQPSNSRASGVIGIDQGRTSQGRNLQQQALVLNGRSVSFSLGQTVRLRVVQALIYKDALSLVPSSVLIERNSGFSARPLWYGDDVAEVEISTTLAQGQGPSSRQSTVSTTLPVQLNEWITIAQTEDAQNSSSSGVLSRSSESAQSSLRIEMRVTVK